MINAFFNYFSTSAVRHAWNSLPEINLPSAKKAALIGVSFFALYKLYRSFQSLLNRVNELEKARGISDSTISNLSGRLLTAERANETLSASVEEMKTQLKAAEQAVQLLCSSPQGSSDPKKNMPGPNPVVHTAIPDLPIATPPLELFKDQFPGRHIKIMHRDSEVTLCNYLMNTIFRVKEKPSCIFDESTGTFILSYEKHKTVTVKQLPKVIWDNMWFPVKWLIVIPLMQIAPGAQISQEIKVKFVEVATGIKIVLDEKSIFLEPNIYGYTAYLKSILIPNKADQELIIEGEHNAKYGKEPGSIKPQLFAEIIDLNI